MVFPLELNVFQVWQRDLYMLYSPVNLMTQNEQLQTMYYHCPFGWKMSLFYKIFFYLVGYSYQNITILCFPIKYIPSFSGVNISPKNCNETTIISEWKSVWRKLANFSKEWNCSIGVNLKGFLLKLNQAIFI